MTSVQVPLNDDEAWRERAGELAVHALNTLIIDPHNWYVVRRPQERALGKLVAERSGTLTEATVARHFEGREVQHLLVVSGYAVIPSYHAVGGYAWLGFSLEPPNGSDEGQSRAVSWRDTIKLADYLRDLGLSVLIEDANGLGTYHVWLALQHKGMADWEEIKSIPAVAFVRRLLEELELTPEVFSPWLPLPGRHHKQPWRSQFWRNGEWLRGPAAVDALLSMPTNPVSLVRDVCRRYLERSVPNTSGPPERSGRESIIVESVRNMDHLAAVTTMTPEPPSNPEKNPDTLQPLNDPEANAIDGREQDREEKRREAKAVRRKLITAVFERARELDVPTSNWRDAKLYALRRRELRYLLTGSDGPSWLTRFFLASTRGRQPWRHLVLAQPARDAAEFEDRLVCLGIMNSAPLSVAQRFAILSGCAGTVGLTVATLYFGVVFVAGGLDAVGERFSSLGWLNDMGNATRAIVFYIGGAVGIGGLLVVAAKSGEAARSKLQALAFIAAMIILIMLLLAF